MFGGVGKGSERQGPPVRRHLKINLAIERNPVWTSNFCDSEVHSDGGWLAEWAFVMGEEVVIRSALDTVHD